jgi:hypothetical protein
MWRKTGRYANLRSAPARCPHASKPANRARAAGSLHRKRTFVRRAVHGHAKRANAYPIMKGIISIHAIRNRAIFPLNKKCHFPGAESATSLKTARRKYPGTFTT